MKCPLIMAGWNATRGGDKAYEPDCFKEECGWWIPAFEICSVPEIAIRLGSLADNVFSIMDKMPPHIPKH